MEVNYNVVYVIKDDKKLQEDELENVITQKLLRVILASEDENVALNNSQYEL